MEPRFEWRFAPRAATARRRLRLPSRIEDGETSEIEVWVTDGGWAWRVTRHSQTTFITANSLIGPGSDRPAVISSQHHAHRNDRRSRRACARPRYRGGDAADSPLHDLRARSGRSIPRRTRLFALREPKPCRARGAADRARGR